MSGKHRSGRRVVTRSEYILKRLLIIIGCLLAVGVILAGTVKIVTIVGRNRLAGNANTEGPTLTDDSESGLKTDPVYASDWQEDWISFEGKAYKYNDQIRTFLIMGIDDAHKTGEVDYGDLTAGGQADGLFLVIFNPVDETIKILAVNRDTEVDIVMVGLGENGGDKWIRSEISVQHAFGGGGEYSCELTRDAVSKLLYDMPIHGYAAVNYQAIPMINDSVGGVTLTIPDDMTDAVGVNKAWKPGTSVDLKGKDAYDFVHYRDVNVFESQRMRLARQKLYLKTFVKKMKAETKENITLPVTIFNNAKEYITSDLTVDEIGYMASEYLGYTFDEDDIYTMEGETKTDEEDYEYFYPDEQALRELIIKLFYTEVDRQ